MKHDLLVGSTGFVGQNLASSHSFTTAVHSTNIEEAFTDTYDLAVYAGVPGTKFLANLSPQDDRLVIERSKENLRCIKADRLVLISTVDVYGKLKGLCETDIPTSEGLDTYGCHRLHLEQWTREHYPDALIVRLPAIYGKGLKKNFVYDLIHRSPAFLSTAKYDELKKDHPLIETNYRLTTMGLWKNERLQDAALLDSWFESQSFNSLCFTDSRSSFQFYDLQRLWGHIKTALKEDRVILNIAPPPLKAATVFEYVYGTSWTNELDKEPFDYDMKMLLCNGCAGASGYLETPEEELVQLKRFILS